ncbi:hypothetical protein D2E25_0897 [Bifidobacterium goeldii]|uniref:Uncharacterized protein n=1 Tax=Bifidobacterium goeldii TaxID=2306975 RepID=A0A430FL01_9BIFI|nr:acyltransferase domain-containing protein [Bifidobacterium goeldii]RSX53574.1 hypothetical protein D2E25_0897 [Bifidobacterium goeldii]
MVGTQYSQWKYSQWNEIAHLCADIHMPQRAIDALHAVYQDPASSQLEALRHYAQSMTNIDYTSSEAAAKALIADAGENHAVTVLAVTLEAALRAWDAIYVPHNIGRDIFTATMANIALFIGERIAAFDDVNFDRAWWCWQYTSGKQYRIGALNFEMAEYASEPAGLPFTPGERLLHVHIPSDASLDSVHTHAAYRAAREFFAQYFPQWANAPMVTETWLLSPALKTMLSERSRILAFARDYEVLHTSPNADDGNFFVFGRSDLPLDQLPQRTGLQRAAAERLRAGGHIGIAYGRLRAID